MMTISVNVHSTRELLAVAAMNSFFVGLVVAGSCFQFHGVVNSNSLIYTHWTMLATDLMTSSPKMFCLQVAAFCLWTWVSSAERFKEFAPSGILTARFHSIALNAENWDSCNLMT
jgi:hypothetical protein